MVLGPWASLQTPPGREKQGDGTGGWTPLPEAHAGGEGTQVGTVLGARASPSLPGLALRPFSVSCVHRTLSPSLSICLFEIAQRAILNLVPALATRPWASSPSPPASVFSSVQWAESLPNPRGDEGRTGPVPPTPLQLCVPQLVGSAHPGWSLPPREPGSRIPSGPERGAGRGRWWQRAAWVWGAAGPCEGPHASLSLSLSLPHSPPAPTRSMIIEDGARPRLPVPPAAAR